TSVWRVAGGVMVDAERRMRSPSPTAAVVSATGGLGRPNSNAIIASLRHRSGDRLNVDQERLVLRRLDVGVADKGRERVRSEPLARRTGEAPVQRNADDVH